ncbi:hypothetical protein EV360DRAFT_14038, partial [Lentinula raphanica]
DLLPAQPSVPPVEPPVPRQTEPNHTPPPPTMTQTDPNEFGLYEIYVDLPEINPVGVIGSDFPCDAPTFNVIDDNESRQPTAVFGLTVPPTTSVYSPFPNESIFLLMKWFYSSVQKSISSLNDLVHNVLFHPNFNLSDLENFSAERENRRMDEASGSTDPTDDPSIAGDGWKSGTIRLRLPKAGSKVAEEDAPYFDIEGVQYRDLVEATKSAFQDSSVSQFTMK